MYSRVAQGDISPNERWPEDGAHIIHPQCWVCRCRSGSRAASSACQLRSTTRSSFLLKIQERPRNTTSITKPRPEEASLMTFSETWPKA